MGSEPTRPRTALKQTHRNRSAHDVKETRGVGGGRDAAHSWKKACGVGTAGTPREQLSKAERRALQAVSRESPGGEERGSAGRVLDHIVGLTRVRRWGWLEKPQTAVQTGTSRAKAAPQKTPSSADVAGCWVLLPDWQQCPQPGSVPSRQTSRSSQVWDPGLSPPALVISDGEPRGFYQRREREPPPTAVTGGHSARPHPAGQQRRGLRGP